MRIVTARTALLAVGLLVTTAAAPAFALGDWPPETETPGGVHHVPEIDAGAGIAALAAVGAVMAFAWERRRRR